MGATNSGLFAVASFKKWRSNLLITGCFSLIFFGQTFGKHSTVCLAGDWTPTACTEVRSATTIANASQPVNIANSALFVCRHCRPFLSVHFGISWVKKGRFGPFGPPHLSALFICKYWWTKRADSALFVCRKIVCPFCLPILVCPFCVQWICRPFLFA